MSFEQESNREVQRPRCTIVVPCYNEARRLNTQAFGHFLEMAALSRQDDSLFPEIRFLFVNDGSRDNTVAVLTSFQEEYPDQVRILDKKVNGGKAEAVRDGMLAAIEDRWCHYVGFWDADLATPLDSIPKLLKELVVNPELLMVFGSRIRLLGRHVHRKASRHYLGRVFATFASLMLHLPVYDTQCGAKIFRVTPELAEILKAPFLSKWVFDVEILARFLAVRNKQSKRLHDEVYEYPLDHWEDVAGSKVKPGDFLLAFGDTVRIYAKYLA
ncbi:glycosyltransferase [Silvibacterium acidisoli]|uniref:glycosyltransferase n=1 Tax=Acidobacteriaceae bacterium ZG23-2 TaxID=2883246 RepID=UPI00406C9DF4